MKFLNQTENQIRAAKPQVRIGAETDNRILNDARAQMPADHPVSTKRFISYKTIRYAAAAIILAVTLIGGTQLWPGQGGQWWLGPSSVWAAEILDSFDSLHAMVYRKQYVFVGQYGRTHVSGSWKRIYQAADRTRTELYYEPTDEDTFRANKPDSRLENIAWHISDGEDLVYTQVYYDLECYDTRRFTGDGFHNDPLDSLRFYVQLLPEAKRLLESKVFDGKTCVGFEISAAQYGDNPDTWIDRIWLDTQTRLPVRIEKHGRPITSRPVETMTYIEDQFEYYAEVPPAFFEPEIPDGFIQAPASQIQAQLLREEKGEMVYADVPEDLKERITDAFKTVETAAYREYHISGQDDSIDYPKHITLTKTRWCIDYYSHDQLSRTETYIPFMEDPGGTSFDFNSEAYQLVQTTIDHSGHTWSTRSYSAQSHPDNPMDRIIFLSTMIDRADRFFEHEVIDGVGCFGFELSAKKYGTNPDTTKHIIWLDEITALPVKMIMLFEDDKHQINQFIQDRFQWNEDIDESVFNPQIPDGYKQVN